MVERERIKQKNILVSIIKEIIEQKSIRTQHEIIHELQTRGFDVNQSLISRLLKNIGVIKSPIADGGVIYHLPWEISPPVPKDSLKTLVTKITHNECLIVVSTSPGAASLLARIIDFEKEHLGILGTVAGDDVIFITPHTIKDIERVYKNIEEKIGT